jgi:hypothetical protein
MFVFVKEYSHNEILHCGVSRFIGDSAAKAVCLKLQLGGNLLKIRKKEFKQWDGV